MHSLIHRPRRLRSHPVLREMVQETQLQPTDLIYPLFVKEGIKTKQAVKSMPGVFQFPVTEVAKEAKECWKKGVRAVLLFGIPSKKDAKASGAYSKNGIIQKAIAAIKNLCPEMLVMTDVCLCEYMSHGHCGIVDKKGQVLNDPTLHLLSETAISHAQAGSDLIAPSDMMDGRVGTIRAGLDDSGFESLPIMSYAVKYASSFYGPFRDAAESAPQFGDRKTYQMDPANGDEAIKEALIDVDEGADIIMVKPALPYLDILSRLKSEVPVPLAAYQVSGEYSMIHAACEKGWLDYQKVMMESLISIKRAGAKLIVSYFTKEAIGLL